MSKRVRFHRSEFAASQPSAAQSLPTVITFEQAASVNSNSGSVTDQTLAISILVGDCVVVGVLGQTGGAQPIVRDDGGNNYSFALQAFSAQGVMWLFVAFNCTHSAANIHITITPAQIFAFAAATYSGVKTFQATANNNPGPVTGGTITQNMVNTNSVMVAIFGWNKAATPISVVANQGNLRTNQAGTGTVEGICLVDSTQAAAGPETCSVTASIAPTNWSIVSIELVHN